MIKIEFIDGNKVETVTYMNFILMLDFIVEFDANHI